VKPRADVRAIAANWITAAAAIAGLALLAAPAEARTYRLGFGFGFGSSSIAVGKTEATQGPFLVRLMVESPVAAQFSLGLEHGRSFTPSPLGSDVYVFNAFAHWYPWGQLWPPDVLPGATVSGNAWSQSRIAPYVGAGTGYGEATLTKEIESTTAHLAGSSILLSIHFGADYVMWGNKILRGGVYVDKALSGAAIQTGGLMVALLWNI
jgi:hypothetical protein